VGNVYVVGVPGLISKLDGLHAILFHVEHLSEQEWFYRWRMVGEYPAPYLVWRNATTKEKWVKIQVEARGAEIEVEWRASEDEPWSQVDLLSLTLPEARFVFKVAEDFCCAVPFTVCSPMRADGVAAYHFPPVVIPAGEEVVLTGKADAAAWPNVLLAPGEFRPRVWVPGMEITNQGPSESWHIVQPHTGLFKLSACPVANARRYFAVGHESVPSSLLKS